MNSRETFAAIDEELRADALVIHRQAFDAKFGARFDPVFLELSTALKRLRSMKGSLPSLILDALPASIRRALGSLSADDRGLLAKEMVARELSTLPSVLQTLPLPDCMMALYPTVVRYTIASIATDPPAYYGNEKESYFDRDLRMAAGMSLPAGAQILDTRAVIPRFYSSHGAREAVRSLAFTALRTGGTKPFFRIHTDTRNLQDFNEAGWNDCYARIAELLRAMPEVRGIVGSSWFYDPQLETVSPRLYYLRRVPEEAGAFLHIDGSAEHHTKRALTRSPTRKDLYDQGKYLPVCATLIWARRDILRWAAGWTAHNEAAATPAARTKPAQS